MNDATTRNFVPGNQKHEPTKDQVDVRDKVIEVTDKVIEVKDMLIERSDATAEKLRRFVRAHPLKAIAIAFAVGYFGMRVTRPLRWL